MHLFEDQHQTAGHDDDEVGGVGSIMQLHEGRRIVQKTKTIKPAIKISIKLSKSVQTMSPSTDYSTANKSGLRFQSLGRKTAPSYIWWGARAKLKSKRMFSSANLLTNKLLLRSHQIWRGARFNVGGANSIFEISLIIQKISFKNKIKIQT